MVAVKFCQCNCQVIINIYHLQPLCVICHTWFFPSLYPLYLYPLHDISDERTLVLILVMWSQVGLKVDQPLDLFWFFVCLFWLINEEEFGFFWLVIYVHSLYDPTKYMNIFINIRDYYNISVCSRPGNKGTILMQEGGSVSPI